MSADFTPSVALAADDFVPVLLSGVGAALLAQGAARRLPGRALAGYAGAALIVAGGMCKAGWKLTVALGGPDLGWLEGALFVLLAPGFVLLASALVGARRSRPVPARAQAALVASGYATALATRSTAPLLVLAVVFATATGVLAVLLARQHDDLVAAGCFLLQIATAFALVPFAAPPQTSAKQWTEQSLNTLGQAAFAYGALRLARSLTTSPRPLQEAMA